MPSQADLAAGAQFAKAIADKYPAFAPFLNLPGLGDFWSRFAQSVASQTPWSQEQFAQELQGTDYWKTVPATQRAWETSRLSDPATAAKRSADMAHEITQIAGTQGIILTPQELQFLTDGALNEGGLDPATIAQRLAAHASAQTLRPGQIKDTVTALRGVASQFGMGIADSTLLDWSKKINSGESTTDAFTEFAKDHAKLAFPSLAKQLDEGFTVRQLADPKIQIAAQTLGISADQVDLADPKWRRALQSRDAHGNITGPMTDLDWQRTLTTDKSYGYDYTANARNDAINLRDQLAQTFGAK